MKKKRYMLRLVSAMGALLLLSASGARANLIVNGSFEDGAFSPNRDAGTMQLFDGSTAITGWTVLGGGGGAGGDVAWESQASNPWGFTASQGDKFVDLTGYLNDNPVGGIHGGLAQTVNGLVLGQQYRLTFDVGSSLAFSDGVNPMVTVNGTPVAYTFTGNVNLPDGPGSANNHWQAAGFTFTAQGSSVALSFLGTTPAYDKVIDLDNVSLAPVPEPTTVFAGLGALGLALAGVARSRRSAV